MRCCSTLCLINPLCSRRAPRSGSAMLRIDAPGPLMLVEDLGRPGFASIGVPASGAVDRLALALANRLLGNAPGDAALEILLGPARVTSLASHWVAITGAAGPLRASGRPAPLNAAFLLEEGDT